MAIATLTVDVVAKLAELETGFDKAAQVADANAKKIQSSLTTISGVQIGEKIGRFIGELIHGFVGWQGEIIRTAEQLQKLTLVTGDTVENLSAMQNAARISGTSFDQVVAFSNRLSRELAQTDKQTSNYARALRELGVSARDTAGNLKTTPQLMREIGEAIRNMQPGPGLQQAITLLGGGHGGEAGATLIPFLKQLAETQTTVATTTSRQAVSAENLSKSWREAKVQLDATGNVIMEKTAPAMDALGRVTASIFRTLAENNFENFNRQAYLLGLHLAQAADMGSRALTILQQLYALQYGSGTEYQPRQRGTGNFIDEITEQIKNFSWKDYLQRLRDSFTRPIETARKETHDEWSHFTEEYKNEYLRSLLDINDAIAKGSQAGGGGLGGIASSALDSFTKSLREKIANLRLDEFGQLYEKAAEFGAKALPGLSKLIEQYRQAKTEMQAIKGLSDLIADAEKAGKKAEAQEEEVKALGATREEQQRLNLLRENELARAEALVKARQIERDVSVSGLKKEGEALALVNKLFDDNAAAINRSADARANYAAGQRVEKLTREFADQIGQVRLATAQIGKSEEEAARLADEWTATQKYAADTAGRTAAEIYDLALAYLAQGEAMAKVRRDQAAARSTFEAAGTSARMEASLKELDFATSQIMRTRDEQELAAELFNLEMERMSKTAGKSKEEIDKLNAVYDAQALKVAKAVVANQRLRDVLEPLAEMADSIGEAFGAAFEAAALDSKDLGEAVANLARDIERILIRELISDPIAKAISNTLRKAFSEAKRDIGGLDLGSFWRWLIGFGGGGTSAMGAPNAGPQLQLAGGGYVAPGGWAITGEQGPELLFGGRTGATVIPAMRAGGSPIIVNIDARTDAAEVQRSVVVGVQTALAIQRDRQVRNAW